MDHSSCLFQRPSSPHLSCFRPTSCIGGQGGEVITRSAAEPTIGQGNCSNGRTGLPASRELTPPYLRVNRSRGIARVTEDQHARPVRQRSPQSLRTQEETFLRLRHGRIGGGGRGGTGGEGFDNLFSGHRGDGKKKLGIGSDSGDGVLVSAPSAAITAERRTRFALPRINNETLETFGSRLC